MMRQEQKIWDVTIFTWEEVDIIDTAFLQFYNVEFPYKSMEKYNGCDVSLDMNGQITITSTDENCEELWKGFAIDIPEFWEKCCIKRRRNHV